MSVNKFGSSFSRSGDGDVAKGVDKSYVDNAFLWKHGDVMKGTIDMSNNRIFNLPPPLDVNDPVTKAYSQQYLLSLDQTVWDCKDNKIINVKDPTNGSDCAHKKYVDDQIVNSLQPKPIVTWKDIKVHRDVFVYSQMKVWSFADNICRITGIIGMKSGKERKMKIWEDVAELPKGLEKFEKVGLCFRKTMIENQVPQMKFPGYIEPVAFILVHGKIHLQGPIPNTNLRYEFDYIFQLD